MARTLETQIDIDAAPETVWSILTDLDGYAEWNPFITSSRGDVEVGAQLVNRMEPPDGRAMTFRPTVTEVEVGRVFEWLGRLGVKGIFDGRHRFELSPLPDGGTRLDHSETFSGVLTGPLMRMIGESTRAGFEAMNDAIKARAEARTTCAG